ncbi:hypothetical protein ABGB12_34790 [Actinocorallia sp. B10E7]|uniref:hypothetical protein n=1 Tax=Actinocorallia sp. B10E7 TaxID=3153558 RepID=UPI00325CA191
MIDPRPALPFLLLVAPSAVLCGVFGGLVEADHHDGWVMGVLGGACIGVFVILLSLILVLLGDTTPRRPRYMAWGGLALTTLAGYLAGTEVLAASSSFSQWALPLLCLLPLPLTWAAIRATSPPREQSKDDRTSR